MLGRKNDPSRSEMLFVRVSEDNHEWVLEQMDLYRYKTKTLYMEDLITLLRTHDKAFKSWAERVEGKVITRKKK